MNNEKVSVNDVLEALAIRLNDVLRPDKKSKNKKNNAYFWTFKFIFLLLLIWLITIVFNSFEEFGVSLIYIIAKSLRSVLSIIWIVSLSYIKGLLILYLLFDNLKIFVESEYYDNLYESNRKLRLKKETVFKAIELILKVFAVFYMIGIAVVALVSAYILATIVFMLLKNVYVISPILIFGSILLISFFTFMHIKNKFFSIKQTISKNHFIFAFSILFLGVFFFGYETNSYEYKNQLPDGMELTHKEQVFTIKENQKIELKNNSKLDNLEVIYDDTLEDEMKVEFEYFETAEIRYVYTFNENDDLQLSFSSRLDFHSKNLEDVFNLVYSTFNRKTIYNYNLFKYPNITVRINPKYEKDLKIV